MPGKGCVLIMVGRCMALLSRYDHHKESFVCVYACVCECVLKYGTITKKVLVAVAELRGRKLLSGVKVFLIFAQYHNLLAKLRWRLTYTSARAGLWWWCVCVRESAVAS